MGTEIPSIGAGMQYSGILSEQYRLIAFIHSNPTVFNQVVGCHIHQNTTVKRSFLFLLTSLVILLLRRSSLLPPHTSWTPSTERRSKCEIDVLLRVKADNEGWNIDDLLANTVSPVSHGVGVLERVELPDVTLADQDTGMMDTLCQPELVDTSLQSTLQEIFDLERQDVIEFHAGLIQHPNANETSNEGIPFKQSLRVFLIECQKLTSRLMSATVNHVRALEGRD